MLVGYKNSWLGFGWLLYWNVCRPPDVMLYTGHAAHVRRLQQREVHACVP